MGNQGELFTIDTIFTWGTSSSVQWMYHANYAWNWRPRGGILALTRNGIFASREENEVSHVMSHTNVIFLNSKALFGYGNKISFPHSPIR